MSFPIALSWAASAILVLAQWEIGYKRRWGFLLSSAGELAWIIYALLTRQWSLAFICSVFGAVSLRNWYAWR